MDEEYLVVLLTTLFALAYVMYFFFLRTPKKNKIDPFASSATASSSAAAEGEKEKYWTHSQRVVDEERDLKCIVSTLDGERYCVRDRENLQASADLLAKVTNALQLFINDLKMKYPSDPDVDRLYRNYDARAVSEILPNSMYEAVTTNKGEEVEFCLLESKSRPEELIDEHTLFFVALHEITHIMCKEEDHPPLFWKQFAFLLKEAKELGYHEPRDYAKNPKKYCDRQITDSPYFNWRQYQQTYAAKEFAGNEEGAGEVEEAGGEKGDDTDFDTFKPRVAASTPAK